MVLPDPMVVCKVVRRHDDIGYSANKIIRDRLFIFRTM
ncbi:hypothetical protein IMCC9480_3942 [Oxalobacteraceae bacterium IMCC9480]|nr:hypothetical protein IMCC9480_3942 [Oxalobacteraceae bacterium IMCC9480]